MSTEAPPPSPPEAPAAPPGSPAGPEGGGRKRWGRVLVAIIVLGALSMAGAIVYLRVTHIRMKRDAAVSSPEEPTFNPLPGMPDEALMRRDLEAKAAAGTATKNELRLLKAVCSHTQDTACRDRAIDLLEKREQAEKSAPRP